jgi:uncharacterized membrane protein YphA (DoxX/SURF4 family)
MYVATVIVSVLLAALLARSAVQKLSHQEQVVQSYRRAGVPEDRLDHLAVLLLAGAAGLLLGLLWALFGVVAAAALVCYFAVAAAFHIRAGDARRLPTPLAMAAIAATALALRLATL